MRSLIIIICLLLIITACFLIYNLHTKHNISAFTTKLSYSNRNYNYINSSVNDKFYLSSSGGGIRAFYGAYCFIKALNNNKNSVNILSNIQKIGVVSGSSWFFTSLYSNNDFYKDVNILHSTDFIQKWNNNYCNNIRTFINSNILQQSKISCSIIYQLLHLLKFMSQFVKIPGSNWSKFVNEVILKYPLGTSNLNKISINEYPELLYGITLPFTIFQRNGNNNAVYLENNSSNDIFYKNNKLCVPIYYKHYNNKKDNDYKNFYSPSQELLRDTQLYMHKTSITDCKFKITNGEKYDSFKISNINPTNIDNVSAACSAAVGLLSAPVVLSDLIKDKLSLLPGHNTLCNSLERCLPDPRDNIDFAVPVHVDDISNSNKMYKLIDGAYTDNSGLAITLSNILSKNPDKNDIINIISLDHSPLKAHLFSDNIDSSSSDFYRLFNNNDNLPDLQKTINAPLGGEMPNPILFNEKFPSKKQDWNWNHKYIKYHKGTYTTVNNIHFGIKHGYTINLVMIAFNWKTGMIDFNLNTKWLEKELNRQYTKLCSNTISELDIILKELRVITGPRT